MPNIPINLLIFLSQPILKTLANSLVKKVSEKKEKSAMAASLVNANVDNSSTSPNFLIVDPNKGKKRDVFKFMVGKNVKSGMSFLDSSDEGLKGGAAVDHRWILLVSIIIRRILNLVETPLKYLGLLIDFFLNLVSQNGGFFGIIHNFFHAKLRIPRRDTENFISTIGQLDGRIDLYRSRVLAEKIDDSVANKDDDLGNKYLMDLCIMASKLVYENEKVVQNVINDHWKMHLVAFFNCWNEEEPFNAQDWSTDFDFSWYELPKVGKLHVGFLEALGLGNRSNATSFQTHLQKKHTNFLNLHTDSDSETNMLAWAKKSAYYAVAMKLKNLLKEHKNAKFVVTGHSLGGALAILFSSVLVIQEENEMVQRLLNVYTFGQPRIGDSKVGSFMESHLNYPNTKYFRVVYCNDMVPRVPFDDKIFAFKHFGTCLYYDSGYFGKFMEEEPNRNFFGLRHIIPMRINAIWEVLRSVAMKYTHGSDYEETWFCTFFRVMGLVLPGIASHSPIDYVNSVRLGRERVPPFSSLKSFTLK